jgi:phage virion morphogenesis protein
VITFDLRNLDAVRKNRIEAACLNYEKRGALLNSIGVEIETQTQNRFDTKIDPQGNRWKDIADATEKYYRRRGKKLDGKPRPPLLISGSLRDSIVSEVQSGNWSVIVGAAKEYADVHQFGYAAKNIPARPFVGISSENETELNTIIENFLRRAFK